MKKSLLKKHVQSAQNITIKRFVGISDPLTSHMICDKIFKLCSCEGGAEDADCC